MKICSNGIVEIGSEDTVEMLDFLNWSKIKVVKLCGNVSTAILQALPAHVTTVGFYSDVPREILQAIEAKRGNIHAMCNFLSGL